MTDCRCGVERTRNPRCLMEWYASAPKLPACIMTKNQRTSSRPGLVWTVKTPDGVREKWIRRSERETFGDFSWKNVAPLTKIRFDLHIIFCTLRFLSDYVWYYLLNIYYLVIILSFSLSFHFRLLLKSVMFCWNVKVGEVRRSVNLIDLIKSFPTSPHLQKSTSIQPRTSL